MAQKLPNLLRRMFAEGAFSAAFVPIYNRIRVESGPAAAHAFAEAALSVLVCSLLVILLAAQAAMPWVVTVFAPGFSGDPEKFNLAVDLARIVFPYIVFISAVALVGGVLNSLGRFGAFVGCSRHPDCKYTRQFSSDGEEAGFIDPDGNELGVHPETGETVWLKSGRFGPYVEMANGEKRLFSLINATVSHEMRNPTNSMQAQVQQ